jgi:DDE superfamily endonuclease
MQLPIVKVASIVQEHAQIFRSDFNNRRQFEHFQNYVTGLIALENKSMANIARCVLGSADKTNLARFFSEAPWQAERINQRRVNYMCEQTSAYREDKKNSVLALDDTLCEHVGSLFEYVDQHYNHGNGDYPLAHNLVTSHYVSGAVRFPVDVLLYRRYDELTDWANFVGKHFPGREIPKKKKELTAFHKRVDPVLLTDPAFRTLHKQFCSKITLAIQLVEQAITHQLPFQWVLFDGWYLAPDLITALQSQQKDWISVLKPNRNLETNSFVLRDEAAQPIRMNDPQISVENLIKLIPKSAFTPITLDEQTYYTFTFTVRIPSIGKVRLVISFNTPELDKTGVVLVSNRLDCSAKKLIATYLLRWPIETFYQDSKQLLALDDYRMRLAEAIQKHWSLVFVAYSFLHLDCLAASLPKKSLTPLKSIGAAVRQQTQGLIQDLILYAHHALLNGQSIQQLFTLLFAKQQPIPT